MSEGRSADWFPLEWHESCLENAKRILEGYKLSEKTHHGKVKRLALDIAKREAQIAHAKKLKMEGFSYSRLLKDWEPEQYLTVNIQMSMAVYGTTVDALEDKLESIIEAGQLDRLFALFQLSACKEAGKVHIRLERNTEVDLPCD